MKILALEMSSAIRSVAVLDSDTGAVTSAIETRTRHSQVFALITQALQEANCPKEAIDCLVVGIGPGSYTGIRMAISAAQGWYLGRRINLLGISSIEALAARAHAENKIGTIDFIVDAQRGEFYLASYEISAAGWHNTEPLQLVPAATVAARRQAGRQILGPEADQYLAGAQEFYPAAAQLAQLAVTCKDFRTPENLEPIYLRPTQFVKAPPPRIIAE